SRLVAIRQAKLERVNLQLRKLYGPLYALLNQSRDTWVAFAQQHWPKQGNEGYFVGEENTEEEKKVWRLWMKEVFMPLNDKIEQTIVENADLVVGGEIPKVFKVTLAHIAGYRPVIRQWAEGDFSRHTSFGNWPGKELFLEVEEKYKTLVQQQRELIHGLRQSRERDRVEPAAAERVVRQSVQPDPLK